MLIRTIKPNEYIEYAYLVQCLEAESDYLKYGAFERDCTPKRAKKRVSSLLTESNSTIIVAEENGELIGHITVFGQKAPRAKHRALISMGVLQKYWGQGIGTQLIEHVEAWARKQRVVRLELTIVTYNQRALALCEKMGFRNEGVREYSLCIDGEYVDEFYMAKIVL